uniref:RDD domain-containing protein n=1 Tax=Panagrellus redivivus TaxID=6233 RepID=A0A7E4V9V4_PANRE
MTSVYPSPLNPPCNNDRERVDYGSAKAYADEVREWVELTQTWMMEQQRALLAALPPLPIAPPNFVTQVPQPGQPNGFHRFLLLINRGNRANAPQIETVITQQHQIPSFARRAAAELLDFLILFFFKMIFVCFLVEFELVDLEQYINILNNDVDLNSLIDLTQGLFHVELVAKVVCGIVEAYAISFGLGGYPPGCTPGKFLMKLQVITCLRIAPVAGSRDIVTVSRTPSVPFGSSVLRAIIKNSVFNVLFPLNMLLYFFSYNRAVYDIVARTVVVSL